MTSTDFTTLPKAVLHDHLDGGLRVSTILELADMIGHRLPSTDESTLSAWFYQGNSGSLERYLAAFDHTVAVMQDAESISRIAYEAVEDLGADGVVYAEIRFDPGLCTQNGLTREDVLEAAMDGFSRGSAESGVVVGAIVCALRHLSDSEMAANAAVRFLDEGVVGFDLAGPEAGYPPDDHLAAMQTVRNAGLGLTIHAGEGDGPHSMWRALALCGAQRLGHGVHIVEDTQFEGFELGDLGAFATRVRDHRVPLEVAITSNLHTASFEDAASHPFGALYRAGFNVSLSTDNRLMSDVSMSDEYSLAATAGGLDTSDLGAVTVNALMAGFGSWTDRRRLIEDVVKPAYGID